MTTSHWRYSPTPETLTTDAVVIGGGICGVSAALALQRRGLSTSLLERGTLASGASGRNAGFLMRGAADHYADAIRLYGRPIARLVWKWTEDNLADLRREGIEAIPSYRRIPSCLLALSDTQAEELQRSAELLREDGFAAPWITSADDTIFNRASEAGVRGGLVNPHDASINPIHLVRHLVAKLTAPQTTIYEHTPALRILPVRGHLLRVETPTHAFITPRILLATNAYAPLLVPSLSPLVTPRRGQMFALPNQRDAATCSRPITLAHSYYANHGSEYLRQTADGSIVIGGCRTYFADRETGYDDTTTDYVQGALERFAASLLGPAFLHAGGESIATRWSGTMGFSPDGLPLVGPLPEFPGGAVWFCGAFTGHGMSMGFRTATVAVHAMLDGMESPFPLSRAITPEDS
jgi:gamma-glutamylputrescine oxidase